MVFSTPSHSVMPFGCVLSSVQISSVAQLCPALWDSIDCSTPGYPIHHQLLELSQTQAHRIGDHRIILSSAVSFASSLQFFPASGSFPVSQFFPSGDQSIGVSASESVLPMNIQCWFPLALTGLAPCSPRDSQKSSPTPQFKSINSSALSFLYGPTLTSIHDYWKNHSFD